MRQLKISTVMCTLELNIIETGNDSYRFRHNSEQATSFCRHS